MLHHSAGESVRGRVIHEIIQARARATPSAVALDLETETITYDELERRSNQLARHLRRRGLAREGLVGLCAEPSLELLVGLLGIWKAGGACLRSAIHERQQVRIDDLGMGGQHAVREAGIDLERAVLDQLGLAQRGVLVGGHLVEAMFDERARVNGRPAPARSRGHT